MEHIYIALNFNQQKTDQYSPCSKDVYCVFSLLKNIHQEGCFTFNIHHFDSVISKK